jgi:predicted nucleotidyltransferase
MKLSALLETLRKLVEVLEGEGADYMLLGGLALPAYGRVRATYDIDLAIQAGPEILKRVEKKLTERGFQLPAGLRPGVPLSYLIDLENQVSVEFWFEPDGIDPKEAVKRRWRVDVDGMKVWIVGPEDFIVNKLARRDRSELDEHDVISVLERQKRLDEKYLERRSRAAGVLEILRALRKRVEETKARRPELEGDRFSPRRSD